MANELELQGIPIELAPYNDHINLGEEGHTVLLTGKAQMLENGFILKMLETYRERGIFLGAEDGGLMAYSGDYTVSRPLDKEAVLFSYQKIYGHPDTLFVIGGDSINYVETLVNTLIQTVSSPWHNTLYSLDRNVVGSDTSGLHSNMDCIYGFYTYGASP
ncbi:hypothetical protein ADUPG1_007616, partial [Aduncisulcus paluster]